MVFGAEFLAEIALLARHQTHVDFGNKEPNIQQLIHNISYMDDIGHSYDNLLEVRKSTEISRRHSKRIQFNQFVSSTTEVLDFLNEPEIENNSKVGYYGWQTHHSVRTEKN